MPCLSLVCQSINNIPPTPGRSVHRARARSLRTRAPARCPLRFLYTGDNTRFQTTTAARLPPARTTLPFSPCRDICVASVPSPPPRSAAGRRIHRVLQDRFGSDSGGYASRHLVLVFGGGTDALP